MKKIISAHLFLILCVTLLVTSSLSAKQIPTVTGKLRTSAIAGTTVTIGTASATNSIQVTPVMGTKDYNVQNTIALKFDQATDTFFAAATEVKIKLNVKRWDITGTAMTTKTYYLKVNTNNKLGKSVLEQSIVKLSDGYKVEIKIDSIWVNQVAKTTLPRYVVVESEINMDRYYDFSSASTTTVGLVSLTELDNDCDGIHDELLINWSPNTSAEEYQLEWAFVNNYSATGTGTYAASSYTADFKHNSSRLSLYDNNYKLSLLYDKGYLVFRVRAIGRNYLNHLEYIYGPWSSPDVQGLGSLTNMVNRYTVTQEHDKLKNWQYAVTYAEEGKKKEIINYFDGSLHNRQSVTKTNSNELVIVGETIYDYQGRPAVNVLPVPVVNTCTISNSVPSIKYYTKFNVDDTNHVYSKNDFDLDGVSACEIAIGPMDTISGASQYYSNNNPDLSNQQAFVPHAKKYPFTQVEYTPDNTGRIQSQSGVGKTYVLGSGKETKYLYGQPNQIQLDRLFGSEAGDASHYKKNAVIDANGQTSVTYLNQEGKTVATALAGVPPIDTVTSLPIVDSLEYANINQKQFTVDLFNKDANGLSLLNKVPTSYDKLEFNTQLLVSYRSLHEFKYNLKIDTLKDACLRNNICFNCIYDLDIQVKDECGLDLAASALGAPAHKVAGKVDTTGGVLTFSINCSGTSLLKDSVKFNILLEPGVYTVSKVLSVNEQAKDFYVKAYLDSANNQCVKTLNYFKAAELAKIDTMDCYNSCANCVSALGTKEDFVAKGKGSDAQYEFLLEQCTEPCRQQTICKGSYDMMLVDVSPGGQYGKFNPSTFDTSGERLSVFNTANVLNANTTSGNQANWKYPRIRLNGNLYSLYLDEDGNRKKVVVTPYLSNYLPAVDNTALVYIDVQSGQRYTYPENLANVSDFIPLWDQGFSKSLVIYHPEYAYYISCSEHSLLFSGETLTSDGIDSLLYITQTFSAAVTKGFITASYTNTLTAALDKLTAIWQSTVSLHDPFFTNSAFVYNTSGTPITGSQTNINMMGNTYSGLNIDIRSEMLNKITNYQNYNGTNYNMAQVAALLARCGTSYGAAPTSSCMAFGTDFYPSPNPAQQVWNDSIRNREWQLFRQFYISEKQKLQFKRMEFYAKYGNDPNSNFFGGSNCCFGNSAYDVFQTGMLLAGSLSYSTGILPYPYSAFLDGSQPCGEQTWQNYSGVVKRFFDPANTGLNTSNVAQQLYQTTGQCPMAFQLQTFLNGMAQRANLSYNTEIALNTVYEFNDDLYKAVSGGVNPASYINYQWTRASVTSSLLTVYLVNPVTSTNACTLTLNISGTSIPSFDSIKGVSQLIYNAAGSGTGAFKAVVVYKNSGALHSANVTGNSSCINLKDCSFAPQCTPNQFALDVQSLISKLQICGVLQAATTARNISRDTLFNTYVTTTIKNTLGAPNSKVMYKFIAPDQAVFYDSLNSTTKLQLTFFNKNPSAQFANIKAFVNINSNFNNAFTIQGKNASGNVIIDMDGQILKITPTSTMGISMGNCSLPGPIECQQKEHKVRSDLEDLVNTILSQKPFNSDLNAINFSNLLKSYSGTEALTGIYIKDTSAIHNYDTLTIQKLVNGDSLNFCGFNLYHHRTNGTKLNFTTIIKVEKLQGIGTPDISGNYYQFMAIATYSTNSGLVQDTVYGKSCWPLKNCDACIPEQNNLGAMALNNASGSNTYSLNIVDLTSACDYAYVALYEAVNAYNHSSYAAAKSYSLDLSSVTYTFVQSYCKCMQTYVNYLQLYTNGDASILHLPLPVWVTNFTGCPDGSNCMNQYEKYVTALNAYNKHAESLHKTVIDTIYSPANFVAKYCACAPTFIGNLFAIMGGSISHTVSNVLHLPSACQKPCQGTLDTNVTVIPYTRYVNPCVQQLLNVAKLNAENAYKQYIDSMTTTIASKYTQHCLGVLENFTYKYVDKEYHFTLYYYDQAGNLVRTIPPEGIEPINIVATTDVLSQRIRNDRTNNLQTVFTAHRMSTKYVYNSLNQLTYQSLPDHDNMDICEGNNPRGLDTGLVITSVQFVNANKGYLTGFIKANSILNRGLLYTTNNGGNNWQKVNGLTGGDLQKVQFAKGSSANMGYAISTNGLLLKTKDAGGSWDLVTSLYHPSSGNRYTNNLTAMHVKADTGIVGGIYDGTNPFMYFTSDSAKTFAPCTVSGSTTGDTITGISYYRNNGYCYIASSKNGIHGKLFRSNNGTSWSIIKDYLLNDLTKVQYVSNSLAIAVGEDGTLIKSTSPTTSWELIPTGFNTTIRDIYFTSAINGVALVDSIPGKAKLWKTFNGGLNWEILSAPGEYYTSLQHYGNMQVLAVGYNGLIAKLQMGYAPFGIIKSNAPNTDNYTCGDAIPINNNNLLSVVASSTSSKIHISYNTQSSSVNWLTTDVSTLTIRPIPSIHATFKKVLASVTNTTTPELKAILLTNTGKLYSLNRTYNGSTVNCDTVRITGSQSGKFFNDITSNNKLGVVNFYAFDTISKLFHRINFSGSVATGTALANNYSLNFNVSSIALHETSEKMLFAFKVGVMSYCANTNSATLAWTSLESEVTPTAFNDVKYYAKDSIIAVGIDGSIWTNKGVQGFWQLRNSGTAVNLNAVSIGSLGIGLIAGDNGKLYKITNATTLNPSLTPLSSPVNANYTDVAVDITTKKAYATSSNGKVVYIPDYISPIPTLAASPSASSMNGVAFRGTTGIAYAVGNNAGFYLYSNSTAIPISSLYTKSLISSHFYDANNGYVIDTMDVIRRTTDGGNTWQTVIPETGSKRLTKVYSPKMNQAILIGKNRYVSVGNANTLSTATVPSYTSTVDFFDVNFNSAKNYGVIVGSGLRALQIKPLTATTYSIANIGQAVSGSSVALRAVHVFDNNSFITAGQQGKIYYCKAGTFKAQTAYTAPAGLAQSNITFNDIYFHDNYTGYVVGSNGAAYKAILGDSIAAVGTTSNTIAWNSFCSQTVYMAYNTNAQVRKLNFNAIAFCNRTKGMIAGYDSNIVINTSFTPNRYARLINEQSGYYSTRFWYDKLGRMVLSQNTKQFNKTNPANSSVKQAFSYTLYDALGRITEVGEKFENQHNDSTKLSSIFGSMVNNYYNLNTLDDAKFARWLKGGGSRREVTKTYYDLQTVLASTVATQQNLRKRVASVTYEDVYDGKDTTYQHATHYTYDIHGNVNSLWQENPSVKSIGQNFKRVDYDYDLISGKVNNVHYQTNAADAFHHHYEYDADNRITQVYTSTDLQGRWIGAQDDPLWTLDAKYFYYNHGPLARVEYGKHHVQGVDYAYTLQGWIKGVNSNVLSSEKDMGQDGDTAFVNGNFAKDVFGYTLNYYKGDYDAVDFMKWNSASSRFETYTNSSDLMNGRTDLFNGNISAMATTISKPNVTAGGNGTNPITLPLGNAYRYDQLNRIKRSSSYTNIDLVNNLWKNDNSSVSKLYRNAFTYDASGNINTQMKYDSAGVVMDSLVYRYEKLSAKMRRNRLYHVNELASSTSMSYDIENQGTFKSSLDSINKTNNYSYDEIGNLVKDSIEEIDSIKWTVYGKIKAIKRFSTSGKYNLYFDYDASGNRIAKHLYSVTDSWKRSTYYVRDAQGNTMSVYEKIPQGMSMSYKLKEQDLYGSSRLGTANPDLEMIGVSTSFDTVASYLGHKQYEYSNHLGNVLTVISDKKIQLDTDNNKSVDYYIADITQSTDYYPFGQPLPGRNFAPPTPTVAAPATPSIAIVYKHTFESTPYNHPYTVTPDVFDSHLANSGWTNSYNPGSWTTYPGISNAGKSLGLSSSSQTLATITLTFNVASGHQLDVKSFSFYHRSSNTGYRNYSMTINNISVGSGTIFADVSGGTNPVQSTGTVSVTNPISNLRGLVTVVITLTNRSGTTGTFRLDNFTLNGYTQAIPDEVVSNKYRYGFNGKENDGETVSTGQGTQDYGMRIYNPALGRFFSIDPITDEYPELTPYQFASNKPISSDDKDGLEENDRTTYVHMPNPKLIQSNVDMIDKQAQTQSSSFKLGSNGVMKWAGYVLVKSDATRVEYQKNLEPLKGKKDIVSSQTRANLKAEFRPKTPQPFRTILDKSRPLDGEQAKVREGGNSGKSNPTVDAMNNVFGAVGKGLIVYSALNSASSIYNADDPLRQTAIEGGSWTGAIGGGTAGAELGAIGGWPGSVGLGIVLSIYGGIAGEEAVTNLTKPKDNSPSNRVKQKNLTEKIGSEAFESKKEVK